MNTVQATLFPGAEAAPQRFSHGNKRETYQEFVEKFKPKKTTDDCYTPPAVYEAVLHFARERLGIGGSPVARPFYPGGDYERHDYPAGCVVVDNPPFSLYSRIVRFYLARGIRFLLFAPQLTCFVKGADCAYLITDSNITYENGAVVRTAFVTNLCPGLRIWLCPELRKAVEDAQKVQKSVLGKNTYPPHAVTSAILGKIAARGVELKLPAADCFQVSNLDGLKAAGKSTFGSVFLLSERATAERATAERAAAERAAGITVQLSEREWEIVRSLSRDVSR